MRFNHFIVALSFGFFAVVPEAFAHCDTLSGPVVAAARAALKTGDATAVLRWVRPDRENDIRSALTRALVVRKNGPEAEALADQWFFETVVRLHRQGEGEPFTGLTDQAADPMIAMADAAIGDGSLDRLKLAVAAAVMTALKARFNELMEAKSHADESVEAGRRFTAAYAEFMHYVEQIGDQKEGAGLRIASPSTASRP